MIGSWFRFTCGFLFSLYLQEAQEIARKERGDIESSHKEFLLRLFPEFELSGSDESSWKEDFAAKIQTFKSESKSSDEVVDTLKQRVLHYQTSLKETVSKVFFFRYLQYINISFATPCNLLLLPKAFQSTLNFLAIGKNLLKSFRKNMFI